MYQFKSVRQSQKNTVNNRRWVVRALLVLLFVILYNVILAYRDGGWKLHG